MTQSGSPSIGFAGIDLGSGNAKKITKVRFYPRAGQEARMAGGKFQGSNTSQTTGFTDLYTISGTPATAWTDVVISDITQYRYLRYISVDGGYGNVAEVEFYTQ